MRHTFLAHNEPLTPVTVHLAKRLDRIETTHAFNFGSETQITYSHMRLIGIYKLKTSRRGSSVALVLRTSEVAFAHSSPLPPLARHPLWNGQRRRLSACLGGNRRISLIPFTGALRTIANTDAIMTFCAALIAR